MKKHMSYNAVPFSMNNNQFFQYSFIIIFSDFISVIPKPKYFSKNNFNFSITSCFFFALPPPPKRDTVGIILSISVLVVFNMPSRNELNTNFLVSSGLSFSTAIISTRSFSSCSKTNLRQSVVTCVSALTLLIKASISYFLLRSCILASTALRIDVRISLSSQLPSWYFSTSIKM